MGNSLNISEKFYSVQCEGHTTGYPAYFIRFKGCNLQCGIGTKHISEILKAGEGNTPSGDFVGNLHKEGCATWTCDTAPIWLFGKEISYQDMVSDWEKEGVLDWIKSGRIHLIWTGGEPTIPKTQQSIVGFLRWFYGQYETETKLYNEVETNGTFVLEDSFFECMHQINCSVKLENSGMSKEKRIVPEALQSIMKHPNYWFKFVISEEKDLKEIEDDFIKPFNIPWDRVIMMPGLDSQDNFHERTRFVLEMAKKYGFIGLTRLHVSAYDRTTGV